MAAFYGDGTGLCYWCLKAETGELYGVPLCDDHYGEETAQLMRDAGIPT